jgi:hypothetical protein
MSASVTLTELAAFKTALVAQGPCNTDAQSSVIFTLVCAAVFILMARRAPMLPDDDDNRTWEQ